MLKANSPGTSCLQLFENKGCLFYNLVGYIAYFCNKTRMTNTSLYTKISTLPPSIQSEVTDYVEFLLQKHTPQKRMNIHPKAGCMKGTFTMSKNFNEPLSDFNDYMQ